MCLKNIIIHNLIAFLIHSQCIACIIWKKKQNHRFLIPHLVYYYEPNKYCAIITSPNEIFYRILT